MNVLCLDMEGVLTPEIWHHVRDRSGISELGLTTRDVKDYRELMDRRVEICAQRGLNLARIQALIAELDPLPGAREFLDWARTRYQVFILSDTFYEFADPLIRKMGYPTLLCHHIGFDEDSGRLRYTLRQDGSKSKAVDALHGLNFRVAAVGDSYNDVAMLRAAEMGILFRAPAGIVREFPEFSSFSDYADLRAFLNREF